MENVPVQVVEAVKVRKEFSLKQESHTVQLAHHLSNLFVYFHADNEVLRHEYDKQVSHSTQDILDSFEFIMSKPDFTEAMLNIQGARILFPLDFRVSQLVTYYGVETITSYVQMVYGKVG